MQASNPDSKPSPQTQLEIFNLIADFSANNDPSLQHRYFDSLQKEYDRQFYLSEGVKPQQQKANTHYTFPEPDRPWPSGKPQPAQNSIPQLQIDQIQESARSGLDPPKQRKNYLGGRTRGEASIAGEESFIFASMMDPPSTDRFDLEKGQEKVGRAAASYLKKPRRPKQSSVSASHSSVAGESGLANLFGSKVVAPHLTHIATQQPMSLTDIISAEQLTTLKNFVVNLSPLADNTWETPTIISAVNHLDRMAFDKGSFKLQALRSANEWSLGKIKTENSIYQAYLDLIEKSQRFIYIENQFFISSTSDTGVKNQIAQALVERVKRAITERAPFKVIVFMPLMPAFEANLEEKEGPVMQIQIGLQNQTINKGENSMLQQLRRALFGTNMTVDHFVQFCSLRTWQRRPSDQTPMTELIYIHSKVASAPAAHDRRRLQDDHWQCEHQRPQLARLARLRAGRVRRGSNRPVRAVHLLIRRSEQQGPRVPPTDFPRALWS
jgi:hypothetical protein